MLRLCVADRSSHQTGYRRNRNTDKELAHASLAVVGSAVHVRGTKITKNVATNAASATRSEMIARMKVAVSAMLPHDTEGVLPGNGMLGNYG